MAPTNDKEAAAALNQADSLLEANDASQAATLAEGVLAGFNRGMLARAALIRGKALLDPLLSQIRDGEREEDFPTKEQFREPWTNFMLSRSLEPENEEAKAELEKLNGLIQRLPAGDGGSATDNGECEHGKKKDDCEEDDCEDHKHGHDHHHHHSHEPSYTIQELHDELQLDVLVVGAGASGVGVGLMLTRVFGLEDERVLLIERGDAVGESFRRWPKEMRFISPSFNQQGWTKSFDLNSIAYGTSPAFTLHAEHPTGEQYATYLSALAEKMELPVRTKTEVRAVRPLGQGQEGFEVEVADVATGTVEVLKSRYVIWAAGEFQYPRSSSGPLFSGSQHCLHNSAVASWKDLEGDDFVVIGGYESGMDAASNLAANGKRCTVVSSTAFWHVVTEDPSTELAPYTAERVRAACSTATPPKLMAPLRVHSVEPEEGGGGGAGGYLVKARYGAPADDKPGPYRTSPLADTREETTATSSAGEGAEGAKEKPAEGTEVTLRTPQRPVLCAGFEGSVALGVAKDLFAWGEPGAAKKEKEDEEEKEGGGGKDAKEGGEKFKIKFEKTASDAQCKDDDNDCEGGAGGSGDCQAEEEGGEKEGKKKEGAGGCADGAPLLNDFDESTKTPGLFLVGPAVRHGELSFCFVYKFRQRFGVVADAIAKGLGMDTKAAVAACREMNMFLDDFECCKAACGETC